VWIGGATASQEGGIVQRIILKRLLTVVLMVLMVLAMAIPAFATVINTGNSTSSFVWQNVGGVGQDSGQQVESGNGSQTITIGGVSNK
jgi:hypothetical protein